MRKRPLALFLFSFCMLSVAMSLPIQVVYLQGFEDIFQTLTWLNIFIILICASTAVAAYNLHKSFLYLLSVAVATVIFNNWWVGHVGLNFDLSQTSMASLGFLTLCSLLLEKKTYKVLYNPQLKWWNNPLRSKIEIPVTLSPLLRGPDLQKKSFDISESGFFLQGFESEELERLKVGEKFSVCFYFRKILKIRCEAKVVRKCVGKGSYPAGVGLQFEVLDAKIKAVIRRVAAAGQESLL